MARDQLVEEWFINPDMKRQILSRFEPNRVGEEAISAKATSMRIDQLSRLASMRDKAEAHARSLLREIAFYKSREESSPPAAPAGYA